MKEMITIGIVFLTFLLSCKRDDPEQDGSIAQFIGLSLLSPVSDSAMDTDTGSDTATDTDTGSGTGSSPIDTQAPEPGDSGQLGAVNVGGSSLVLYWSHALDNRTGSDLMEYRPYYSKEGNIGTVSEMESSGTYAGDFVHNDPPYVEVTGLEKMTKYYFNVLAMDEAGNKAAYTQGWLQTGLDWSYVEGKEGQADPDYDGNWIGLNYNPREGSGNPGIAVFNGKLYITWEETIEMETAPGFFEVFTQIRVAVYNGDDDSPSWSFVDGGGEEGINHNTLQYGYNPYLFSFNGKLYATWNEYTDVGGAQIRVAVYNGDDDSPSWSFVDGDGSTGLNYDSSDGAWYPRITVYDSRLYATWEENNKIRVAVYSGDDASPVWSFVDGGGTDGLNYDETGYASFPDLAAHKGKLYAAWNEYSDTYKSKIRVAVYSGNDSVPSWSFVDGETGLTYDALDRVDTPRILSDGSSLYLTWYEEAADRKSSSLRVMVYNNTDSDPSWSSIDGGSSAGLSAAPDSEVLSPALSYCDGYLYSTWIESSDSGNGISIGQVRVARYNGDSNAPEWLMADGGGAYGLNYQYDIWTWNPAIACLNSRLYITWDEAGSNSSMHQIGVIVGR